MSTAEQVPLPLPPAPDTLDRAAAIVKLDRLPRTGDDLADLDRYARAAWTRIAEPGNQWSALLIRELGPVEALAVTADRSETVVEQFRPRLAGLDVPRDLEIAARFGARLIVPSDEEWPRGVNDLDIPPLALWVRGPLALDAACAGSVAIVGARAATHYGTGQASELGWALAERGHTVISGAAYGIDAAAHEGALAAGGATVAVLACGVDRPYPSGNAPLLATIAERGCVVSEVAPGSAALRSRFLGRNRLIATMSAGTVVVEAGLRSGSRNTAGTASAHHRVVMAVPGPVTSAASAGCHEMIRSGMAALVTDADDVVELLAPVGEGLGAERTGASRPNDALPPGDARVLDALTGRARSIDKVAEVAGMSARDVTAALGRLALADMAVQAAGGWRTAPRPRT